MQSSMPLEMTQAGYATYRGVSRQAIFDLIERQRIPESAIRIEKLDHGREQKWINVAAADFALGETQERIDTPTSDAPPAKREADPIEQMIGSGGGEDDADRDDDAAAEKTSASVSSLTQAKAQREHYGAKIAELEYHKRLGELVPAADVAAAADRAAGTVLTVLKQLSTHAEALSSACAANGAHGARVVLKTIERDMLVTCAGAFKALATAAPDTDETSEAAE